MNEHELRSLEIMLQWQVAMHLAEHDANQRLRRVALVVVERYGELVNRQLKWGFADEQPLYDAICTLRAELQGETQ